MTRDDAKKPSEAINERTAALADELMQAALKAAGGSGVAKDDLGLNEARKFRLQFESAALPIAQVEWLDAEAVRRAAFEADVMARLGRLERGVALYGGSNK